MTEAGLIGARDLAGRLGISYVTLNRWVASGRLPPPVNPGSSKRLFRVESVDLWLKRAEERTVRAMGKSRQPTPA